MAHPIHPLHLQNNHPPPRRLDGFHVQPTQINHHPNQNQNQNQSIHQNHNHNHNHNNQLQHPTPPSSHFFGSQPSNSSLFTDAELIDSLINPPPGSHSSSPPQLAPDQPFPFNLHHLSPSPSLHSLPRSSPLAPPPFHSAHALAVQQNARPIYSPRSGPASAGPTELFPDHALHHGSFSSMALDEPLRSASRAAPIRRDSRPPLAASVPTYLSSPSAPRLGWEPQSVSGEPGRLADRLAGRSQDKLEEGSVCSSVQSYSYLQPRSAKEEPVDQQKEVLSEKRRRRRESHNAVERRRRDNINDRIAELATLLPNCMLEPGPEVGGMMMVNEEAEPGGSADTPATASEPAAPGGAHCKPNKGIVLAKSVEYIKHLKDLLEHQLQRNQELEQELTLLRRAGTAQKEAQEAEVVKQEPIGFFEHHGLDQHDLEDHHHGLVMSEEQMFCGNGSVGSRIDAGFGFF